MARLNIIGFETGQAGDSEVEDTNVPSVVTSPVRSGAYAGRGEFRCYGLAATGQAGADFNVATLYAGFFLHITAFPATDRALIAVEQTTLADKATIRINTDGTLSLLDSASAVVGTSSAVLNVNQWHHIAFKIPTSASPANGELWINQIQAVSANGSFGAANNAAIECFAGTGGFTPTYDDLIFDDAAIPAPNFVSALEPNGTFANTNWTDEGGAAGSYTKVSERPHDSDTTYVKTSTNTSVFGVDYSEPEVKKIIGPIYTVKGWANCRDTGTSLSFKIGLNWNGTVTELTAADGGGSYTAVPPANSNRFILRTTNSSGGTITPTDLKTLRTIVTHSQSQARELRCTAMGLFVEHASPFAGKLVVNQAVNRASTY